MAKQLSLRCRCGRVRGVTSEISARSGNRVVCYCDDCQAFAHYLQRADVLDSAGGTDIFQMSPANVRITQGEDALRSVRLSPKGMIRFYTDCCRTPVGNTLTGRLPFVGLVHSFMDPAADGTTLDDVLGKPIARTQGRFAVGPVAEHVHSSAPPWLMFRVLRLLAQWWLTSRKAESPFFDAQNVPRAKPQILTSAERDLLRPATGTSTAT